MPGTNFNEQPFSDETTPIGKLIKEIYENIKEGEFLSFDLHPVNDELLKMYPNEAEKIFSEFQQHLICYACDTDSPNIPELVESLIKDGSFYNVDTEEEGCVITGWTDPENGNTVLKALFEAGKIESCQYLLKHVAKLCGGKQTPAFEEYCEDFNQFLSTRLLTLAKNPTADSFKGLNTFRLILEKAETMYGQDRIWQTLLADCLLPVYLQTVINLRDEEDQRGRGEIFKLLLEAAKKAYGDDIDGFKEMMFHGNLLHLSVRTNLLEIVNCAMKEAGSAFKDRLKCLFRHCDDPNQGNLLNLAVEMGSYDMTKRVLEVARCEFYPPGHPEQADPKGFKHFIFQQNNEGLSPLEVAERNKASDICDLLKHHTRFLHSNPRPQKRSRDSATSHHQAKHKFFKSNSSDYASRPFSDFFNRTSENKKLKDGRVTVSSHPSRSRSSSA